MLTGIESYRAFQFTSRCLEISTFENHALLATCILLLDVYEVDPSLIEEVQATSVRRVRDSVIHKSGIDFSDYRNLQRAFDTLLKHFSVAILALAAVDKEVVTNLARDKVAF